MGTCFPGGSCYQMTRTHAFQDSHQVHLQAAKFHVPKTEILESGDGIVHSARVSLRLKADG